ncbi:PEPxxWA-CTERM sorting domain-containing protein [Thermaurantiacus sp.]
MRISTPLAASVLAFASFLSAPAVAVTVTQEAGNLLSFSWNLRGNVIEIVETWGPTTDRFVYLKLDGLEPGKNYVVDKFMVNLTGKNWPSFSHELGFGSPGAFIPSNNFDGLSFAQGSGIPRTSDKCSGLIVDELGDRDYLNFILCDIPDLATARFSYGLRANFEANNPFLLKQGVIPEPGTWAMLIAGFGLVGFAVRRRKIAAA